jgi:hypothetical protein
VCWAGVKAGSRPFFVPLVFTEVKCVEGEFCELPYFRVDGVLRSCASPSYPSRLVR